MKNEGKRDFGEIGNRKLEIGKEKGGKNGNELKPEPFSPFPFFPFSHPLG